MSLNFIRNIIFIIVLLLVQTLLLNHISVFGCATPLLYVYFALTIQRGESKWATLLWCFAMGLLVDIFSNTPGVAAAHASEPLNPVDKDLCLERDER